MPPSSWPTHPDVPPWWLPEGRAALARSAKSVRVFDGAFRRRAERLRSSFLAIPSAAGLAANQVGWRAALFVARFSDDGPPRICVNPRLLDIDARLLVDNEGCLSLPGFHGAVARPASCVLTCEDERGITHRYALSDFSARLVCHEVDHLNGRVYLQRLHRPLVSRDADYVEFLVDPSTLAIPEEAFVGVPAALLEGPGGPERPAA